MNPDALALEAGISVRHSVDKIRTWETSEHVTHLPLVDGEQRLLGMLPLRRLLLAPPDSLVDGLIDETYESLPVELDQESVAAAFDRHDYVLMPVVDDLDRLLGIITVDDVIDIIREEATEDAQKQVGAGGYEAVWSTAIEKYRGRTPWLMVSVLSLIPALGVVALFEDTIEQVAVLAVLMPLAAAITGNAGHQALAVTLRGITLNEMRRVRIGRLLRLGVGGWSQQWSFSWRAGGGAVGGSWLGCPWCLDGARQLEAWKHSRTQHDGLAGCRDDCGGLDPAAHAKTWI